MNIKDIDENFALTKANKVLYEYYSYNTLTLEGFPWYSKDGELLRLPKCIFPALRDTLIETAYSCAGGVVRFGTNSEKIAVRCKLRKMRHSSGMPLAADAGLDLYNSNTFIANFRPEVGDDFINMEAETNAPKITEYSLYMPLYSGIESLEIGVLKGSEISKAIRHKIEKPTLFYGSSVTNGGCASRPGLTYPAIVTRHMDASLINLGFSGNAKGEQEIARTIAELDISLLVMEYDHNAPNIEYLRETHMQFFETIRNAHKDIPIIIMSRPHFNCAKEIDTARMRDIVKQTYLKALKDGDKNTYFLDGMSIFLKENMSDFSADLIHPNDLGFSIIANEILPIVKKALNC